MGSTVILDLMGGIALLLWGLHMVHSGVVRAFGADLRRLLGIALKSRLRAFLAGQAELVEFHQQVVDSLSLSVGIFMSGDINIARQLIAAKAQLREREFAAAERYFVRLREGTPDTIESYSLDLDILRDLKRVHSHLCSAAYPVLERAGALQRSRLKDTALRRPNLPASRLPTKPQTP
jgi:phosphate:Na+ symporter